MNIEVIVLVLIILKNKYSFLQTNFNCKIISDAFAWIKFP